MTTIRQVAKACGVSPMTVSFVINHKQGQVSPETRERVLKTVRELGYRPTAVRRVASGQPIMTLGVVAGVEGDSLTKPGYYSAIMNGILWGADQLGHNLTLFPNTLLHTDTARSIRNFCDGRCEGIIVISPGIDSPLVATLQERGISLILIGDTGDEPSVSCVDVDNVAGGFAATEYLWQQGHRRIGYIGGAAFVRSTSQRLAGYRQAIAAYGGVSDPALEFQGPFRQAELLEGIREMLRLPDAQRPTALFCWNDGAAGDALEVAKEFGLQVPRDLSIIGFDDDAIAIGFDPLLTTMRQPYRAMGRRTVELAVAQIRGTAVEPQREAFPLELIVRDSVAPPRE